MGDPRAGQPRQPPRRSRTSTRPGSMRPARPPSRSTSTAGRTIRTPTQVDGDATRRASLRAAGIRVWTLTYSGRQGRRRRHQRRTAPSARRRRSAAPARNHAGKGIGDQLGSSITGWPVSEARRVRATHGAPATSRRRRLAQASRRPSRWRRFRAASSSTSPMSRRGRPGRAGGGAPAAAAHADGREGGDVGDHRRPRRHTASSSDSRGRPACTAVVSLDTTGDVEQDRMDRLASPRQPARRPRDEAVITTTRTSTAPSPCRRRPFRIRRPPRSDSDRRAARGLLTTRPRRELAAAGGARRTHRARRRLSSPAGRTGRSSRSHGPPLKVGILPAGARVPADRDGWSLQRLPTGPVAELLAALDAGACLMPTLVFAKQFLDDFAKLQPLVRQKVRELPDKFEHAATSGVHLEKLNARRTTASAPSASTSSGEASSSASAKRATRCCASWPTTTRSTGPSGRRFGVNPVTGIVEILDVPTVAEHVERSLPPSRRRRSTQRPLRRPSRPRLHERRHRRRPCACPAQAQHRGRAATRSPATCQTRRPTPSCCLPTARATDEVWQEIQESYAVDPGAGGRPRRHRRRAGPSRQQGVVRGHHERRRAPRTAHRRLRGLADIPASDPADARRTPGLQRAGQDHRRGRHRQDRRAHAPRAVSRPAARRRGMAPERVLVATYTRSLASNLTARLRTFCTPEQYRALHVTTVDALAQQVLASTTAATACRSPTSSTTSPRRPSA